MSDNPIQLLTRARLRRGRAPRRPPRSPGRPRLGGVRRRRDLPRRRLARRTRSCSQRPRTGSYASPSRSRTTTASSSRSGRRSDRGSSAAVDRLDPLARELDDYFAGRRQGFDVPLDLRLARGFRLTVLRHLSEIPYGSTESYGEVAVASGSPTGRAGGRVGVRDEPAADRRPVPPRRPLGRLPRRLPRRSAHEGAPPRPRARRLTRSCRDRALTRVGRGAHSSGTGGGIGDRPPRPCRGAMLRR